MKLVGALLILYASLSLGLRICAEQKKVLALLRELLSMLEQLQGELELRSAPLPDLFASVGKCVQGEAGAFLRGVAEHMDQLGEESFCEIWSGEVRRFLRSLPAAEREELLRLGLVLGRMDLEAELRALARCRSSLDRSLLGLRQQLPAKRRLALGLSAAAGLLTVILMI